MAFASTALIEMQRQATGGRNSNLPSAVNSGLVGVTTNPNNNSYHHSKNSAPYKGVGSYTNRWHNDLVSNHPSINRDAVTGFDQSMNRADMIRATGLFRNVFNDTSDPRRKYFAEIIGTTDGISAFRMDFADGSIDSASADHTWHLHGAWWYLYWGSWDAADATLSVLRGETKAQYVERTGGEVDMTPEERERHYGMAWRIDTVINDHAEVPDNEETREFHVAGQENKLHTRLNSLEDLLHEVLAKLNEGAPAPSAAASALKGGKH